MTVDVHRHVLTPRVFDALSARTSAPYVRRGRLVVAHEADAPVTAETGEDALARLTQAGLDRGVVALSAALGVERLPADEAQPVLSAWRADVADLPAGLTGWDAGLDAAGTHVCLPATDLVTPAALDRLGPFLEALERRDGVLFVHPGPAGPGAWLPALTAYPASLLSAWLAWTAHGRAQHPRLKVLFAALAGLGPVHAERIAARGGPTLTPDPLTYFDTSSYGPIAAAAVALAVGDSQIVYGSDHPWAGWANEHQTFPSTYSTSNPRQLMEDPA